MGKEGRPKLKGKKIMWGIRDREGGKGIKTKVKGKRRQRREGKKREEMTRLRK